MQELKVTVIARFKAKHDKADQAKQALMALVAPSRSEPGCINYDLHQEPGDPTLFLFYENWTSQKALDEHANKPYLLDLKGKVEELFVEPVRLEQWSMISQSEG